MPPALPPCVGFSNEEEKGIHEKDERYGKRAWCVDWGKVRTPTDWPETGLVGVPALPQPTRFGASAGWFCYAEFHIIHDDVSEIFAVNCCLGVTPFLSILSVEAKTY